MEIIRKKTDYALRCLVLIAQASAKQRVSVHYMAEQEEIPEDLLHKIMQALRRAKVVKAMRGRTGGFRLAKPADKITVLDVLEVLQGPFAVSRCFHAHEHCPRQEGCWLRDRLVAVQEEMPSFFRSVTIADLVQHGVQSSCPA